MRVTLWAAQFAWTLRPRRGHPSLMASTPEPRIPSRFDDDAAAHAALQGRFTESRGTYRPLPGVFPTPHEWDAICELCDEWDYSYEPTPLSSTPSGG